MKLYARQGDLVIEKLATPIAGELVKRSVGLVLAGDSSGHRHRITGNILMPAEQVAGETRLRVLEPLGLVHEKSDGHHSVMLEAGDYLIRPLRERGDSSDRAVED